MPFIRWQDIADIIIMSFLAYQLYNWFKHTRAMQVLLGMVFLFGVYFVTKNLGLFMTSWILQELGTVLFVLIIVIFQAEIRQALYRISLLRNLFGRHENLPQLDLAEISGAIFGLAKAKTGAIVVFQRRESLDDHLLHGIQLNSLVSGELLSTIFQNGTPLHDGAVLIKDSQIALASCHLPLSARSEIPQYYGTRHRAGIGLTEKSDAVVVIVSEERGEVSLALEGELESVATPEDLHARLHDLLHTLPQEAAASMVKARFFSNMWPKIITTVLVVCSWLIITTRQGGIFTVTVPIRFHNLPGGAALIRSVPEEVDVQLKVFSSLVTSPKQIDVVADIDLAKVKEGVNLLPIRQEDLNLPLGVVATGMDPANVRVTIGKKIRKTLQVKVKTSGKLPGRQYLKNIRVEPSQVTVEGPEHLLSQYESIVTEDVNLGDIRQSSVVEKKLVAPASQIRVQREEPVKVRVITGK